MNTTPTNSTPVSNTPLRQYTRTPADLTCPSDNTRVVRPTIPNYPSA